MDAASVSAHRSGGPFSGAAYKQAYNFVSAWEKQADLDATQLSAVSLLADCANLPEPAHLAGEGKQSSQTIPDTPRAADGHNEGHHFEGSSWQGAVLRTSAQFYKWYSELSGLRRQAAEAEHGAYLDALSRRLRLTEDITARAGKSLAALDALAAHHRSASAQARASVAAQSCVAGSAFAV
jgi:hypothetical protein